MDGARPAPAAGHRAGRHADHGQRSPCSGSRCTRCRRRAARRRRPKRCGLPLWQIPIPSPCPNEVYERAMAAAVQKRRRRGIHAHRLRRSVSRRRASLPRRASCRHRPDAPLFPLFGADTTKLAHEMVDNGLRARLTCVDPRALHPRFAGREFDAALLDELPAAVDPCGERGEFHTFAYDGPMFAHPHRDQAWRHGRARRVCLRRSDP